MKYVIVITNQSLADIAIQEDGSVMTELDWAIANGISPTDDLVPGQKLIRPNSGFKNSDVANYFKANKQMIATFEGVISSPEVISEYEFPMGFPLSF